MDTAPEPFLLLEPEAAPRLEALPSIVPIAEPVRRRRSPALVGAAILGFGLPILWAAWLISALFDRWGALGWAGLVVLVAGLSLIGVGMGRELYGAWRHCVGLIGSALTWPAARRSGLRGRHGVGWRRCRSTPRSCRLWPRPTPRKRCLRCCVPDRPRRCGTRRTSSDGQPLYRASRLLRRPLRLHSTR